MRLLQRRGRVVSIVSIVGNRMFNLFALARWKIKVETETVNSRGLMKLLLKKSLDSLYMEKLIREIIGR